MADLYRYGNVDPIYFKLTLTGTGVAGVTLNDADIKLGVDGGTVINVGDDCAETTMLLGIYKWTPAAASQTQGKTLILNIKATGANIGVFDENCLVYITGGDALAQLDAV